MTTPKTIEVTDDVLAGTDVSLEDHSLQRTHEVEGAIADEIFLGLGGGHRAVKVAEGSETRELSPERLVTLASLKANYDRLSHLANAVEWSAVERSFRAHPEKLDTFAKILAERPDGDLTVVGRENGEIKFMEVAPNCPGIKKIAYDREGEKLAIRLQMNPNGNAVYIASRYGATPASPDLYESLRGKVPRLDLATATWLLTDSWTRADGFALYGDRGLVGRDEACSRSSYDLFHDRGVRLEIGVQEA